MFQIAKGSEDETMDEDNRVEGNEEDEENESSSDSDSEQDDDMNIDLKERNEELDAQVLLDLQNQVTKSPYTYDLHTELIKQAKKCGDLEALRRARQHMSEIFPLTEALWKEWLDDEVSVVDKSNVEEVTRICQLYERSVKDYISVELWLDYAMFVLQELSSEEAIQPVRNTFERAIENVGLHVAHGSLVWNAYREIEQGYLQSLIMKEQKEPGHGWASKISEQTEVIKKLFRRQLSLPLMEMDEVFAEYEAFVDGNVDEQIKLLYNKALKKLSDILPFEENLEKVADNEKYKIFVSYIEHEIKAKEPLRVRNLYERALITYCLSSDLWLRYLDFLDGQLKNREWSMDAHERSIRNLPWEFDLWPSYIRALELYGRDKAEIREVWQRAMSTGCSLLHHVVELWMAYLTYLRREFSSQNIEDPASVDEFRKAFKEAVADITEKAADSGNRIQMFWISVEADILKDVSRARELWELVINNHQRDSSYWLDYFHFERLHGNPETCRKVLKKAMLRSLDNSESVAQCWMKFESEVGNLEQWLQANQECRTALKKYAERQAKASLAESLDATKKKPIRQREPVISGDKKTKRRHSDEATEDRHKSDQDGFKVPALPSVIKTTKKLKVTPSEMTENGLRPHFSVNTPEGEKEERTIFLSNMNYNTTEETVFNFLSPLGEIKDIRFGTDPRGKSRGFCYVEFVKTAPVAEAVKLDRTILDGRPVFISKDNASGERESHYKGSESGMEKNKLFIRGLLTKVTADQLRKAFEKFGALKDIRIVTHKNGISKGIAYVEFNNPDTAKKALIGMDGQEIEGKPMVIAISDPPAYDRTSKKSSKVNYDASKPFLPVIAPVPEGQRKSRSHVALVPRAVQKKQTNEELLSCIAAKPDVSSSKTDENRSAVESKKSNNDFRTFFKK